MLDDPEFAGTTERARATYASRARGAARRAWQMMPGERFRIRRGRGIQVTTATLPEEGADAVAEVIAAVEHACRPRRLY